MIVTIGGIKGGVGKSLIAINLTVFRAFHKKRILLIDGDEQATVADWTAHRINLGVPTHWTTIKLSGSSIRTEVKKLGQNYDDIIIDCGGRDTASLRAALTVSDLCIIPFQPKSFDIWTADKVASLIEEAKSVNEKLVTYAVINCAGTRGNDNESAQVLLNESYQFTVLPATIGLRKAFSNATAEGLGIIETKQDKKAFEEMKALHDSIYKEL